MAKPHLWMTTREQTQEPHRRPPVGNAAREQLPTVRHATDDGCTWPAFRPCEGTASLLHLLGGHSHARSVCHLRVRHALATSSLAGWVSPTRLGAMGGVIIDQPPPPAYIKHDSIRQIRQRAETRRRHSIVTRDEEIDHAGD
jgi:hypothetical protein